MTRASELIGRPQSVSYLNRPAASPRESCFGCGRHVPLVDGHIVCDSCHGRMGPCQRYVGGRLCGFRQGAAA